MQKVMFYICLSVNRDVPSDSLKTQTIHPTPVSAPAPSPIWNLLGHPLPDCDAAVGTPLPVMLEDCGLNV